MRVERCVWYARRLPRAAAGIMTVVPLVTMSPVYMSPVARVEQAHVIRRVAGGVQHRQRDGCPRRNCWPSPSARPTPVTSFTHFQVDARPPASNAGSPRVIRVAVRHDDPRERTTAQMAASSSR